MKIFLFGAVTLTKTADIDKYRDSGSGIGFDSIFYEEVFHFQVAAKVKMY